MPNRQQYSYGGSPNNTTFGFFWQEVTVIYNMLIRLFPKSWRGLVTWFIPLDCKCITTFIQKKISIWRFNIRETIWWAMYKKNVYHGLNPKIKWRRSNFTFSPILICCTYWHDLPNKMTRFTKAVLNFFWCIIWNSL